MAWPIIPRIVILTYPADNGTLNAANGIRLYRIGQGGVQDLGLTDLPLLAYNSGTIDKEGNFYKFVKPGQEHWLVRCCMW